MIVSRLSENIFEAIRMIEALNLPRAEEAFPQDVMPDEALKLIRKAQYAQKKYEDKVKIDKKYVESHIVSYKRCRITNLERAVIHEDDDADLVNNPWIRTPYARDVVFVKDFLE